MDCCKVNQLAKECVRSDGKKFTLPRKISKKECSKEVKGFSQEASCAPYKFCKIKKQNINGTKLQVCSKNPLTGWTRSGKCEHHSNDYGKHNVCEVMDKQFLEFTK